MDVPPGPAATAGAADPAGVDPGTAPSILFPAGSAGRTRPGDAGGASFLDDLNLTQVITAVVQGRGEYDLEPLFRTRLAHPAGAEFRHGVLRDLERDDVRATADAFARDMRRMRRALSIAAQRTAPLERRIWHAYGARTYTDAVQQLTTGLAAADVQSDGLRAFRGWLAGYAADGALSQLATRTRTVLDRVAAIRFCLHIENAAVTVTRCDEERRDFTAEVARTFARFRDGRTATVAAAPPPQPDGLDELETAVLDRVARRFPDVFDDLQRISDQHPDFVAAGLREHDREVQFYLAWLDHIAPMRQAGLPFCYPQLCDPGGDIRVDDTFDLALADRLAGHGTGIVRNDVALTAPERVLVITGANQGGKTTYARMVGQLFHLAALGLPVPGRRARLHLADQVRTHFPTRERLEDLRGRLEDELQRLHDILETATPDTVIILNEILGSTKVGDATVLAARILERIEELGSVCAFVTFLDDVAAPSPARVSLVAGVDPDDPTIRTFSVTRRPAEGRAHALAVAEKYGLTYDRLRAGTAQ